MSTDFKNKYNFLKDKFWQDFIIKNYQNPLDKLLFSINQKLEVDSGILANQLKARQIIETKYPLGKIIKISSFLNNLVWNNAHLSILLHINL